MAEPETADAAEAPGAPPAELEAARREAADLRERWLRARADYENLQKRAARDAAAERGRQRARILEGFLPLLDLADAAAHQAETHPGPLSEGVALLAREFARFAEREGLARTGAVGERADPALHEVVAAEAADGVEPGCVSRVVQRGYVLDGKVLRFAKVCVAAAPEPGREPD